MMPTSRLRTFLYLLATSFLVSALAFVNRYPLVYFDTHAYILGAFELKPLWDRPMGYPFMIRAVTWMSTLWTVVIFQGFLISWLLLEWLRKLLPPRIVVWKVHVVLLVVLLFFTSMPWYAAQIMPDIFAPIAVLTMGLLLFAPELSRRKRMFLWTALTFFLLAHYSFSAMTILLVFGLVVWKLRWRQRAAHVRWSNIIGISSALAAGMLFTVGFNAQHGLGLRYSPASNCFFAGRLCEGEVLANFLRKHCDEKDYPVCPYKEELPRVPGDFLWAENSIMTRVGGMLKADSVLAPMIHDLMTDPESFGEYLQTAVKDVFIQLFQVDAGSGIVSNAEDSNTYKTIRWKLPREEKQFLGSLQYFNTWRFEWVNRMVRMALLLSVIVIAWTWKDTPPILKQMITLLLVWVFLNALVTASLANVYDRLQSRVAWLVVLGACLVLLHTSWGRRSLERHCSLGE